MGIVFDCLFDFPKDLLDVLSIFGLDFTTIFGSMTTDAMSVLTLSESTRET